MAATDTVRDDLDKARQVLLTFDAQHAAATLDVLAASDAPDLDLRSRILADADLTSGPA
jgi:hypothetical protein